MTSFLHKANRSLRYRITLGRWRLAQLLHKEFCIKTLHGPLFISSQDEVIGRELFFYKHFHIDFVRQAIKSLREKGLMPTRGKGSIVDIGANNGVCSIGLLRDGEFERAVGIEADAYNYSLLLKNVARNRLESVYIPIHAAVSETAAKLTLVKSASNLGDHRIMNSGSILNSDITAVVQADSADNLIRSIGMAPSDASVVWVDVQGHECHVLAGGRELFQHGRPTVMEFWPVGIRKAGKTQEDFCGLVSEYWKYFWEPSGDCRERPVSELPALWQSLEFGDDQTDIVLA